MQELNDSVILPGKWPKPEFPLAIVISPFSFSLS